MATMEQVIQQLGELNNNFATAIGTRTDAMIAHNNEFITNLRDRLQQLKLIIDRLNDQVLEILNRVQQIDPRIAELEEALRQANEEFANSGRENQLLKETIRGLEDQIGALNQEKERYIVDLQRIIGELNERLREVANIDADKIQMDPQSFTALEESINILRGNIDLLFNQPGGPPGNVRGQGPQGGPQGGPPGPQGNVRGLVQRFNNTNPLNRNNQISPGGIRRISSSPNNRNNQLNGNNAKFNAPKRPSQLGVNELMKQFQHSRVIPENQKIIENRRQNSMTFGGRQHTRRRKYSTKKRGGYNLDNPNPSNTKKHDKRRNSSTTSSSASSSTSTSSSSTSHHSKKGLGRGKGKTRKSRKSKKSRK